MSLLTQMFYCTGPLTQTDDNITYLKIAPCSILMHLFIGLLFSGWKKWNLNNIVFPHHCNYGEYLAKVFNFDFTNAVLQLLLFWMCRNSQKIKLNTEMIKIYYFIKKGIITHGFKIVKLCQIIKYQSKLCWDVPYPSPLCNHSSRSLPF